MECMLFNKQRTGKSEITFNLRPNNHRKDVNKQNSLQTDQHFWLPGHNFNKHAKFTLIEQLLHAKFTLIEQLLHAKLTLIEQLLHDPNIENELLTTD